MSISERIALAHTLQFISVGVMICLKFFALLTKCLAFIALYQLIMTHLKLPYCAKYRPSFFCRDMMLKVGYGGRLIIGIGLYSAQYGGPQKWAEIPQDHITDTYSSHLQSV